MTRLEIEKEFENVSGINEAKKVYKTLARKLHPDVGGSDEEFKILNSVYTDLIENKIFFSNDSKIDLELEKIISKILHFEEITIELIGSWIWVGGNTKDIKDKLKELGFKWARKKKMWYYGEMKGRSHKEKSLDEIKSKYGSTTFKSNEKKEIASWVLLSLFYMIYNNIIYLNGSLLWKKHSYSLSFHIGCSSKKDREKKYYRCFVSYKNEKIDPRAKTFFKRLIELQLSKQITIFQNQEMLF